jgi:arylsulfatase A-like enzyme
VLLHDLFPTILEWAEIPVPATVDGRSLAPLLRGENPPWRDAVLLENAPAGWYALRSTDRLYVEYASGERELYDLKNDPSMLENQLRADRPPDPAVAEEAAGLSRRLAQLKACAGASCRAAEDGG